MLGGSAVVGSYVASTEGVAEEARTRGFAAPAFAGCAFVERWCYGKKRHRGRQARLAWRPEVGALAYLRCCVRAVYLRAGWNRSRLPSFCVYASLMIFRHTVSDVYRSTRRLATISSRSRRSTAAKRFRPRPRTPKTGERTVVVRFTSLPSIRFLRLS